MRKIVLGLVLVLILISSGVASAQDPVPVTDVTVTGILTGSNSKPLSGMFGDGAWVGIYRVDNLGYAQYMNSSDCWSGMPSGQGCPDLGGHFEFHSDYNGNPLASGRYIVIGAAMNFLAKWQNFTTPQASLISVTLDPTPVLVDWVNTTCGPRLEKGRILNCTLGLARNVQSDGLQKFEVASTLTGPSSTSSYTEVPLPTRVLTMRNRTVLKFRVEVPKDAIKGFWYCLTLTMGEDAWHRWFVTQVCSTK